MAYALRGQSDRGRFAGNVFAISAILTPFALGAAVGGIASGRVPVGNAGGSLLTSWLNPTSILIGVLAVAVGVHLAAVFLAGDATRDGCRDLADAFRIRALASGVAAGAIALAGLGVLSDDAPRIWNGLTSGAGLAAVLVSAAAGLGTLYLLGRRAFEPARLAAAVSVAAIIAGWAAAQQPIFLPGLTVDQAAAGHSTLVALIIGIALGAVVLVPSLALLFTLVHRGRFSAKVDTRGARPERKKRVPNRRMWLGRFAAVCFVIGTGLTVFADPSWALGLGIASLFASLAAGFALLLSPDGPLALDPQDRQPTK